MSSLLLSYLPVMMCVHFAMLCQPSLIQSVYTQLPSIIVLYVTVPVELVGTVNDTRTSTIPNLDC